MLTLCKIMLPKMRLKRDGIARDVWIARAKVAVALSLIKTKPPSLTGEEYTRLLAQKLRKWQHSLRSTNATLQDENLRLRQKLTLHELGAGDSGFSSDGELPIRISTSQPHLCDNDLPLKEHITFFQSLLGIKSHLRSACQQSQEANPTDTLFQSLSYVFQYLADYKFVTSLPSQTVDEATRTILTLCDQNGLSDAIATSCLEFAEDLLRNIHRVDLDGQRHYAHLLSFLGQSRHLWVKLCDRLVREVHRFGHSVFREKEFDPIQLDTIYASLQSLEVIWGHWSQPDNAKKVLDKEGCATMIEKWTLLLDSSLRHIWDDLPLFHIYVSFLTSLLAHLQQTLVSAHS